MVDVDEAREFAEALIQAAAGHEQTREGLVRMAAHGIREGAAVALGWSNEEFAERIGRVALRAQDGRREMVAELAEAGLSNRQIAAAVGASHETVRRDQAGTNVPPEPEDPAPEAAPADDAGTNVPPEPDPGFTAPEDEMPAPPTGREIVEQAVGQAAAPPPEPSRERRRWDARLRAASEACADVRRLGAFPGDGDPLLAITAREVARALADAAHKLADAVPSDQQPIRRIK